MKNTLFLLLLSSLILFNGCKKKDKDNPNPETTVAQDKANIKASFDELSSCITQIRDSKGAKTITDFLNLEDGEVINEDWAAQIVDSLVKKLDFESLEDENRFDFSANAGTYTWDPVEEEYTKTSTPTDKIIVKFPSVPTSQTNNAILTISKYEDVSVAIDGKDYFLPKAINTSLTVDGTEVFRLTASAAYDAPIPINVNLSVMLNPFTYTITGNRVTDTKFTAALSVSNGSGCTTSASMDIEFTHSDYETIDLDHDVKSISAKVKHNNLEIASSIDVLSLNAIEDPTVEQFNTYVKTNVYYNGSKVGELVFYDKGNDERGVRIVYKDGTMEDTEVYYNPFLDSLEEILTPFSGDQDIM